MNKHFKSQEEQTILQRAREANRALDKEAWLKENAKAIEERNKWVEENGIPFQGARFKPKFGE